MDAAPTTVVSHRERADGTQNGISEAFYQPLILPRAATYANV